MHGFLNAPRRITNSSATNLILATLPQRDDQGPEMKCQISRSGSRFLAGAGRRALTLSPVLWVLTLSCSCCCRLRRKGQPLAQSPLFPGSQVTPVSPKFRRGNELFKPEPSLKISAGCQTLVESPACTHLPVPSPPHSDDVEGGAGNCTCRGHAQHLRAPHPNHVRTSRCAPLRTWRCLTLALSVPKHLPLVLLILHTPTPATHTHTPLWMLSTSGFHHPGAPSQGNRPP